MAKRINATIIDPVGLYATPATKLVDTMKLFKSDIKLIYSSKTVNLKSLMGVLSLGIPTKQSKLLLRVKMKMQLLKRQLN